MTPLNTKVRRKTTVTVRDGGKTRDLIVTIYPGGTLGLRPWMTRREEFISLAACYDKAVKNRVLTERREKLEAKKARKK